ARSDLSFEMNYTWVSNNSAYDALMMGWHDGTSGTSYTNLVYGYYNQGCNCSTTSYGQYGYEDGSSRGGFGAHTWDQGTYYNVRLRMKSAGGAYYEYSDDNGDTWSTAYNSSYSTETNLRPGWAFYNGTHHFDNARVRKWLNSEPTSVSGSEELKYQTTGTLTSNVFNAEFPADWGTLTYSTSGSGTIIVKVRTDSNSSMSGASSWGSCTAITSGSDLTSNNCVDDTDQYLQYYLTFQPTGANTPVFSDISIGFTASDLITPTTNGSNIAMLTAAGGDAVNSNEWSSGSNPYFSWDAGSDNVGGSGLRGYCLYLGTDSNGNPATSKGLLGTSPVSLSNTTCQFIVSTNSINFATASYKGTPWLTSSSSAYYLNVKAVDIAGNVYAGSSASFHFRFDNTPPTNPSGLSAPQGYLRDINSFTVAWATTGTNAATDAHSGLKGYQYRLGDSGTWYGDSHTGSEDCDDVLTSGLYTLNGTYDSLSTGENTLYFRTLDTACNVSASYVTAILKYNADAPSSPENLTVSPTTNTVNEFSFDWDTPTDFQGSASGLSYCYTVNTLPSANTCSFTSSSLLAADAYATQPGINTFYVVAKDEAGNLNYTDYASVQFTANTPAPGIPTDVDIADVSIKNKEIWRLTVSWFEPENTGAGISSYRIYQGTNGATCSDDFSTFNEIATTSGTSYVDSGLIQQDYYYCIRACDSANNCSATSETATGFPDGKFTVPADLTSGPTVTNITTQKATVNWTTDRTSDSKVAFGTSSGEYFEEEPSNSVHTTEHTINLTNLKPETVYWYVAKWTDEDGNTGISDEQTFLTEPAPSVADVGASNVNLNSALITFTVNNASKATVLYGATTAYGGSVSIDTATTESTYAVPIADLLDGTTYHYKLQLEDIEGNTYEFEDHTFDTLPRPRISNVRIQQVSGTAQPSVLVTWESNTEITSVISYYPTSAPAQAIESVSLERTTGEHRMFIQGLLAETPYTLIVKGQDRLANEATSDAQTFTTATDTRPPVISNLNIETILSRSNTTGVEEGAQITISWNTDEPTTSQVEYGEGTGTAYSQRTQEDSNLTFNHTMVISELNPSSVYHLRTIAKDSAGNIGYSVDSVTITPKRTDNALDLVITNLQQIFRFLAP
ncbi:fibronectin type III domain-containing protein, partial [candidate division WWE3 bacterium]|nr:fibronectin type III domain-containing protein [candidate division WWE3 bacterium]